MASIQAAPTGVARGGVTMWVSVFSRRERPVGGQSMLLVRVRLAPSPLHGIGVFAVDPIPSGTEVWRFTPGLDLDPGVLDAQPALAPAILILKF